MTATLTSILDVADTYDAIVFDQFGVLHDGTSAYPNAIRALDALRQTKCQLAVLTNSGKRSDLNRARITSMGFHTDTFAQVMSSGAAGNVSNVNLDGMTKRMRHVSVLVSSSITGDVIAILAF